MEIQCIVKVSKGNEIWSIKRYCDTKKPADAVYRVYCNRRWCGHVTWQTYSYAIASLLRNALDMDIKGEEVRWS